MENIGQTFMANNPGTKLNFRAPENGDEEIMQRNLRDAVTNSLPDVAFHGLNRQRTLLERNIPIDPAPLLERDPQSKELGFSPALLSHGQVGNKQTGIGFALLTPILYYNLALVKAAGGDPDKLPSSWDEVVALAAAIDRPADTIRGMFFDWTITGNWSWQGLLFGHGGSMLNADESKVAFAEAPGQAAIGVLRKFVDAGKMGDIRPEVMFQDFFAGRLGISMQSTAQLGRYNREIGGRFALKCAPYPLSAAPARLPAAGNVAMIFAKDPAKQEAAWKFVKFACGPEGGTMMVKATGYMPASAIPATRQDMLKGFCEQNPNHLISIGQQDVITGWYAFPGQNALKITDTINDHLQTVVNKSKEPTAALAQMARDVEGLLPKRS